MAFGATQAATALRLIAKYGQAVTLTRSTSEVDLVTGFPVPDFDLVWGGRALRLTNYKGIKFEGMDDAFKQALIAGKAIGALLAADGLERPPSPGDILTLADGTTWTVMGSTVLDPAGIPILYTLGATEL